MTEYKITGVFAVYEHTVSDKWANAIINGDFSSLTSAECALLDTWLKANIITFNGHWDGFMEDDAVGFKICEISGLKSYCYTLRRLVIE